MLLQNIISIHLIFLFEMIINVLNMLKHIFRKTKIQHTRCWIEEYWKEVKTLKLTARRLNYCTEKTTRTAQLICKITEFMLIMIFDKFCSACKPDHPFFPFLPALLHLFPVPGVNRLQLFLLFSPIR